MNKDFCQQIFHNCVEIIPVVVCNDIEVYILQVDTDAMGYEVIDTVNVNETAKVHRYVHRGNGPAKRDQALQILQDIGYQIVYQYKLVIDKEIFIIKKNG